MWVAVAKEQAEMRDDNRTSRLATNRQYTHCLERVSCLCCREEQALAAAAARGCVVIRP